MQHLVELERHEFDGGRLLLARDHERFYLETLIQITTLASYDLILPEHPVTRKEVSEQQAVIVQDK